MRHIINTVLLLIILSTVSLYSQTKPYVILISFDGFRWDYANRGITPNLDFVKENGVSAISLRPCFPTKTFPNHISIITGMYPEHHGIISNNFRDCFSGTYYTKNDTMEVRNARWYKGEAFWETAERQGVTTASYFWPGSDINISYRRPTYFFHYEHSKPYEERVDGVMKWLQLPYDKRPHFITLYFDATDGSGHNFGPNSDEVNDSIMRLDSILGYFIGKLKEIDLYDSTNIIVVSDHGMTDISPVRTINIDKLLEVFDYSSGDNGPFMLIEPSEKDFENVYKTLKENENHYKVYKREEVPECFRYSDNALITELVIIAENGWGVETNKSLENPNKYGTKGNHGYDNYWMDMNGIFFACGPAFKTDYRTGTLNNIDIYPLLCKIFNLIPNHLIDGKLERIEYILK